MRGNAKANGVVLTLGATVLILGVLAYFTGLEGSSTRPGVQAGSYRESATDVGGEGASMELPVVQVERQSLDLGSGRSVGAAQPEASQAEQVHGRIIDDHGAIPGPLVIGYVDEVAGSRAVSQADGTFRIERGRIGQLLEVKDDSWSTLFQSRVADGRADCGTIVVTPRVRVAGHVESATGGPVAGARLELTKLVRHLGDVTQASVRRKRKGLSAKDGGFNFEDALGGAFLTASADGYEGIRVDVPIGGSTSLTVQLVPTDTSGRTVRGRVVDAGNAPVQGALVTAGADRSIVVTNQDGLFRLGLDKGTQTLRAIAKGFLPEEVQLDPSETPEFLTLQLGRSLLAIGGRVVDPAGTPLVNIDVHLLDATPLGLVASSTGGLQKEVMETITAGNGALQTRTGDLGFFRLEGLLERTYRLEAVAEDSLVMFVTDPIPAGREDVEIRLPVGSTRAVRGYVLDFRGRAFGGCKLSVAIPDSWNPLVRPVGMLAVGASTRSDDDGWFEFEAVSQGDLVLFVEDQRIVPVAFQDVAANPAPTEVTVVVEWKCQLQVSADASREGLTMKVVDAAGDKRRLFQLTGDAQFMFDTVTIDAELSPVWVVPQSVTEAVFYRDGEEVTRVQLALDPSSLCTIRI
jgi:Carboxypeptidase regulatory-like domain